MNHLRVAAFTGGRNVPSARFRVRQHIPGLAEHGIVVREFAAGLGAYPPRGRFFRPAWAIATLAQRLPHVASSRFCTVTLLQREMLSTTVSFERLTGRPRILDIDDAIWLHRRGEFARALAGCCEAVVCGNGFLAEYFSRWNSNVSVIPTAVDSQRFRPGPVSAPSGEVIGWCGTSSGFGYLEAIEPALCQVLSARPNATLRIVSDAPPRLRSIPRERIEFLQWSERIEIHAIQSMTVGLMPLEDSPWCRGKCSYKMLLYMACGIPVVCSPVGMNREVLNLGPCGVGARGSDEWIDAIGDLLRYPASARNMGEVGRHIVLEHFSLPTVTPRLAAVIRSVAA